MRQYIVVSKPCLHPDCPPRQGIIRGQYESCEIIREVPVDPETLSNKRSLSSADLLTNDSRRSNTKARHADVSNAPRAVEWLMVCRSEPGGTVPRFLIEKGTPPGIIGDAGKFIDWVSSTISKDGAARKVEEPPLPPVSNDGIEKQSAAEEKIVCNGTDHIVANPQHARQTDHNAEAAYSDWIPSSTGIYGIINGAFGVAGSIATGLKSQLSGALSQDSSQDSLVNSHAKREVDEDAESDASSTRSFASALERSITRENPVNNSTTDSLSDDLKSQQQVKPMEKDLQKLWDRRQKLERSFTQFQEKMESKRQGEKEKDATTQAKLREKHDKEAAKQEAKYKRELRKLEEKREQEEKKAEARRKKAADRQERSSLTLELEKVRAEKQVAIKETELLRAQVGELQAQNTMLVAKLGRVGALNREDSSSSQANSTNSKS